MWWQPFGSINSDCNPSESGGQLDECKEEATECLSRVEGHRKIGLEQKRAWNHIPTEETQWISYDSRSFGESEDDGNSKHGDVNESCFHQGAQKLPLRDGGESEPHAGASEARETIVAVELDLRHNNTTLHGTPSTNHNTFNKADLLYYFHLMDKWDILTVKDEHMMKAVSISMRSWKPLQSFAAPPRASSLYPGRPQDTPAKSFARTQSTKLPAFADEVRGNRQQASKLDCGPLWRSCPLGRLGPDRGHGFDARGSGLRRGGGDDGVISTNGCTHADRATGSKMEGSDRGEERRSRNNYFAQSNSRKSHMSSDERLQKDIEEWMDAKKLGFCSSIYIPSKAIGAYGKQGNWEAAVEVLGDMKNVLNMKSNVVMFNTAISACARKKQWKTALRLLEEMKGEGLEPDTISYNAAISACEKGLQWREALKLLNQMKMENLDPNVISYSAAISACGNGLQWKKALSLLREMKFMGVQPNVISYSATLNACAKGVKWEEALELLREMKTVNLHPDVISYNAVISACEKGVQWRKAIDLLDEMKSEGVQPNVISYSAAISACEKAAQWEKALELLHEMKVEDVQPSIISYSAAISACARVQQWEKALDLLNGIKDAGLQPDVISYNAAISACEKGAQWKKALELLDEMEARGLEPDIISYSSAMSACEKGVEWESALELLDKMKTRGLQPNVISYSAAISACEKAVQWEKALELLSEMKTRGVRPDIILYTAPP